MQAVIVAAGESSRFWPLSTKHKHKSQVKLLGRSLIYWTIKGLADQGIKDFVVVRNPHSSIAEMLDGENDLKITISYVVQESRKGTGNALSQAREFIKGSFIVVWPNKINSGEMAKLMLDKQKKDGVEAVLVGAETETPWDYGIMRMENDTIAEIVENPEKGREPSNIKAIGAYLFGGDFFSFYDKLPTHHEADLIDAINAYIRERKTALVTLKEDVPVLKHPWELFGVLDILFASKNFKEYKASSAKIGKSVVIQGSVYIGENVTIRSGTIIDGPAYIGDNVIIGHQNVLRGPVNVERGVITGAFMEIKHSIIQKGTHFHSGYLGDSLVGEACRFGAGFVSANRRFDRTNIRAVVKDEKIETGLDALGCVVGDNTKVGILSGTMPGTFIGSECMVGPGTMIMKHVKDGTTLMPQSQSEQEKPST